MTKLSEVVRETQEIEEGFEQDAPGLLEQLAAPNPTHDNSGLIKMYAYAVLALGRNCDALIELSRSQESFTN